MREYFNLTMMDLYNKATKKKYIEKSFFGLKKRIYQEKEIILDDAILRFELIENNDDYLNVQINDSNIFNVSKESTLIELIENILKEKIKLTNKKLEIKDLISLEIYEESENEIKEKGYYRITFEKLTARVVYFQYDFSYFTKFLINLLINKKYNCSASETKILSNLKINSEEYDCMIRNACKNISFDIHNDFKISCDIERGGFLQKFEFYEDRYDRYNLIISKNFPSQKIELVNMGNGLDRYKYLSLIDIMNFDLTPKIKSINRLLVMRYDCFFFNIDTDKFRLCYVKNDFNDFEACSFQGYYSPLIFFSWNYFDNLLKLEKEKNI